MSGRSPVSWHRALTAVGTLMDSATSVFAHLPSDELVHSIFHTHPTAPWFSQIVLSIYFFDLHPRIWYFKLIREREKHPLVASCTHPD